jgi:hypothetical protein
MKAEPKAMEEIHRIREELYMERKRKKMSTAEFINKVHKEVENIKKKYGVKTKKIKYVTF